MNLHNFKLIVSDLDGTLVKFGSDLVSPKTKEAILDLKDYGFDFTIATGRSWRQTKKIAGELKVTIPVIVQTGALIIDPLTEKLLRIQPLRPAIEQELWKLKDLAEVDHLYLLANGLYAGSSFNTKGGNWLLSSGEECCVGDLVDNGSTTIIKHLFIGSEVQLQKIIKNINAQIHPQPNLILWPPDLITEDWFLEVFDPLASKGQALTWLANCLETDLSQVISFGDGCNDLDMLHLSGLAVAVQNAAANIIAAADLTIPGPEADGIARFLQGGRRKAEGRRHEHSCNKAK